MRHRSVAQEIARVVRTSAIVLLIALAALVAAMPRGRGEIPYHGKVVRMPVPYTSIRIASRDGRATYLMLGYPDLNDLFSTRGPAFGWTFDSQFGGIFNIVSTNGDGARIVAVTELRSRLCTEVEFYVDVAPAAVR